ncbi:DUF6101 family protein [Lentilitoribacter sp. EG35]|jgi:hypothetical protein|uniref:DUF6101 family protein n=1 Tax=Lentilitoribacter sp. EG35 TaxID=3234192 RepID=UPI0034607B33
MATTIRKPEWASFDFRILPGQFPHRFSFKSAGSKKDIHVTLSERGAVIDRILEKSDLPISVALPTTQFRGIAARAIDDGTGQSTVTLELHHDDADLCIPLLVDTELYNIADDWRAWSEAYNIPMLLVEADGVARPLDEDMARTNAAPEERAKATHTTNERRRNTSSAKRRPRFLLRRKTGDLGCRMQISGREIIARA